VKIRTIRRDQPLVTHLAESVEPFLWSGRPGVTARPSRADGPAGYASHVGRFDRDGVMAEDAAEAAHGAL
jgi:hypothetical protein